MDVKKLQQDLRCSVCMNTYTDVKQLPCLHFFCLQCLNDIQRQSKDCDIIKCPQCRLEFSVPSSGNLSDLPTNICVSNMLNVLAVKEGNITEVKCGNCDKRGANCFFCFHCCSFWCEECVVAHNTIRTNRGHRVRLVNDFRDHDFKEVSRRIVGPAFCCKKDHENEELRFYCEDCERAVCNICIVTDHKRHAMMLLEDVVDEAKAELESLINSKKKLIEQKKSKINEIEEKCSTFQKKASIVKRSARAFAGDMIAVIEAKTQEIFEEVDKISKEVFDFFKRQQSCLEKQMEVIEEDCKETEEFVKQSASVELLRYKSELEKSACIVEHQSESHDELSAFCHLLLEKNDTLMDAVKSQGIGSVKTFQTLTSPDESRVESKRKNGKSTVEFKERFVLTTKNVKGEQCYTEQDKIRVKIVNWDSCDSFTTAQVHDNEDGTYFITNLFAQTGKHEISVTINEEHVCGSPFAVIVKPRSVNPVSKFGEKRVHPENLSKPWGIAVSACNEIAVTESDAHSVKVFSYNGTYLRSFGRKGNKEGEFYYPTGIAFKDGEKILVSDTFNHRIQFFCGHGNYLGQFGGEGSLDHQLKYPHGLFVDSMGNIIVADSGNKLVKFFSPSGFCLKKIGEDYPLKKPFNCIQHDNLFLISDISEHCIKVFDNKGKFQYKIGKRGQGDGEFIEPSHVSVYRPGELIICDSLNHRVQIVKLDGTFVLKFGEKGDNEGEFKRPTSSAVLPDDKIALVDCFNDRIQVLSE